MFDLRDIARLSGCCLTASWYKGEGYFLKTSLITRANTCCLQIFALHLSMSPV